uniref:F-box domain-containing protein n=1 Tax=Moniliophthora roreri TaxID=221103 RepID=A0A0W0FCS2_MONRR
MFKEKSSNFPSLQYIDVDIQRLRVHSLLRSGRDISTADATYVNQIVDSLKTRLDECLSLFAPIRKIPCEILSEIFTLAVQSSSKPGQMSWKIASVCSYWRVVSLGIPEIWAVVPLTMDLDDETEVDTWDRVEAILRRSNNCPLTLDVILKQENRVALFGSAQMFLFMLKEQAHRLRHLKIQYRCIDDTFTPGFLREILESGSSHIHNLDVDVKIMSAESFWSVLQSLSASLSPSLRVLRLLHRTRYISPHILVDSPLPFAQLTHLDVKVTSTAAVLLLDLCTNLTSAKFIVPAAVEPTYFIACFPAELIDYEVMDAMESMIQKVTLADHFLGYEALLECGLQYRAIFPYPRVRPNLQSLTLVVSTHTVGSGYMPFLSFCRILGAITCPSISSLSLVSDAHKGYFPYDPGFTEEEDSDGSLLAAINFFLLRSKASLQALDLHHIPFSDRELIELLQHTPVLTRLTIKEPPHDPLEDEIYESFRRHFMDMLTCKRRPPTPSPLASDQRTDTAHLLPNLEHLTIETLEDWEDHSFELMLESRTATLRSVYLKLIGGKEHLDVKRVKRLRNSGMKVNISIGSKQKVKAKK